MKCKNKFKTTIKMKDYQQLALSAKPMKASCMEENSMILTSLNDVNTVFNCIYNIMINHVLYGEMDN